MTGWRAQLLTDTPRSRGEAKIGALYRGWLRFQRNRLAVLGATIVVGLVFVGINLLSDLLYRLLDPRAR